MIAPLLLLHLAMALDAPSARGHFGIAFDEKLGKTIISGGVSIQGQNMVNCPDSWGWDGAKWTKLADGGLTIMGHRMTYDSKNGTTLMLGGTVGGSQPSGDLREWASNRWTTIGSSDLVKTLDPGLCYDAANGRVVAVVANGARHSLSTYLWDGSSWSAVRGDIPEARNLFSIAYDAKRKRVVLFGGRIESEAAPGGVWEFDGSSWEKKTAAGPSPRALPGMVYDDKLEAVVMHGGMGADYKWVGDTWSWNGERWTKLGDGGPAVEFGMAYDKARDRIVLVGTPTHQDTNAAMETWEWDGKAWTQVAN